MGAGGSATFKTIFIFSRKNSEKGMSISQENSGKGYVFWKKFQMGSIILKTLTTN